MSNFLIYLFYALLLVSFLLVLVLVMVLLSYTRLLSKWRETKEKEENFLMRAEEESRRALLDAQKKAREIVMSASKLSDKRREEVERQISESVGKMVQDISKEIRSAMDLEIKRFGGNLLGELKEARRTMEVELEKYRKEMEAGLEQEARERISEIVEKVLEGGISKAKQEQLIREALLDAKNSFNEKKK